MWPKPSEYLLASTPYLKVSFGGNNILTLNKVLIRSIMTYACPAWELAADTYLLKLQLLQNEVLRTIGNFPRSTPVHNLHTVFNPPYVYDYIKYVQAISRSHTKS
jgi:hypothetical protein